jgi:hypothetical protein
MQAPLDFVDPSGLTSWTGTMASVSGGEILGGGAYEFHLKSNCQKGREAEADVLAVAGGVTVGVGIGSVGESGGGAGIGPVTVGAEWVELSDDFRGEPDANSLAGFFGYLSASLIVGGGVSGSTIYLGSTSTDAAEPWGTGIGLDIGVTGFAGVSVVMSSRPKDCKSCDK